ncbi:MAG: protein kinase [Myxococcales bacterium]|nr:protein kinase [Myxococcales bacterium]
MSASFSPGEVVADRYRLVSKLGEGGMGSVWRAEHMTLKSPVALKFIESSISQNEEATARFMREAQSAAALRSTHVVQIFDYGVDRGVPYIAMELLVGESLRDRMDRTRLSPRQLAEIMTQVCRAMSKAHEAGIVHRDLKPDNIFLVSEDDQEVAKVLDFGIAKVAESVDGVSSATRTGTIFGTPYYMSPEQAQGNRAVDYRADLWALAIIVFECVTGKLPFQSDGLGDLILRICVHPVPTPSSLAQVPPGFDQLFAHAATRDPHARFQSAREFADSLKVVLGVSYNEGFGIGGGGPQPWGATPFPPGYNPRFQESGEKYLGLTTNGHAAAALNGTSNISKPSRAAWWLGGGALAALMIVGAVGALLVKPQANQGASSSEVTPAKANASEVPVSGVPTTVPQASTLPVTESPLPATSNAPPALEAPASASSLARAKKAPVGKVLPKAPPTSKVPEAPQTKPTAQPTGAFEDRKW